MYRIDSKEGKRRRQAQNVIAKEIERQNYKMSNLAAALYLAYPGLLFLLNIFMTSSPWLSMKWKPQLKQKKNLYESQHTQELGYFVLKYWTIQNADINAQDPCLSLVWGAGRREPCQVSPYWITSLLLYCTTGLILDLVYWYQLTVVHWVDTESSVLD